MLDLILLALGFYASSGSKGKGIVVMDDVIM
jgi:hypothetical protein